MSYVVNSRLLDVDYRKQHIQALLRLHLEGKDLSGSPVVEWAHRTVSRGGWWYGCEGKQSTELEECIMKRQQAIIDLYCSIKKDGYNGSPIAVYFDKETGEIHTYDGYHRLSIMDFLGVSADVNCVVSYHHPTDPRQRGDFPLEDRLRELNSGEYLYEPCEDPRVRDWPVWRPDSEGRLNVVLEGLVEGSVLDVGCSCGWFSRQLARRGFKVTSLESNAKRLAVARYLSITQNLAVENLLGKWQSLDRCFDNVLMLSVLHHDFLSVGPDRAFMDLKRLRGRCRRLIVEVPLSAASVAWLPPNQKDTWNFTLDEMVWRLQDATGLRERSIRYVHPSRPIIVLEAKR